MDTTARWLLSEPRFIPVNSVIPSRLYLRVNLMKFCYENNIILCQLPSHTSYKLQPCDIGVFGPLKMAYREEVERLYRGGSSMIGKLWNISILLMS